MTLAVDGVARGTTEGVVIARQVEVVLPLVRAMALKIIGVEIRHDTGGCRIDEIADAVIGHGYGRGVVGVGRRDELPRVIVSVVGCDATRPGAASEFAIGRVGVARALSVGVEFVRHAARRFVVEPASGVASVRGAEGVAPYHRDVRLLAVGRHRDLVAVGVVGVGGREPFRVGHRGKAASTTLRILIASNES